MFNTRLVVAITFVYFSTVVRAHVALWNAGMFGLNFPGQATDTDQYWNNNEPVNPLRRSDNLTQSQWWCHGHKGYPPAPGNFLTLPSGGSFTGDLGCNRAFTNQRNPDITDPLEHYACDQIGPLHVMNTFNGTVDNKWFGGTALAISYTNDVTALQPGDMTVISVKWASVWEREIVYQIPTGMPPCPSGGCLCTWNWIHEATHGEGYGPEIYNVLYRCQITGATNSTNVVAKGTVPVNCESDSTLCNTAAKVPMYIYQVDGNNMPDDDGNNPPTYNYRYGFTDGPQANIFTVTTPPAPTRPAFYCRQSVAAGAPTPSTCPH